MGSASGTGYREAPGAPRPYEHVVRLPRRMVWMNLVGGVATGLFIFWLGYRFIEIRCERGEQGKPIACAVTANSILGSETRRGTVREGARATIVKGRAGRSQTSALGVIDQDGAQPVPLTPAMDRMLEGGAYERMVPRFDEFLRDRTQRTFEDRTSPSSIMIGLAAFLALSGVGCALLLARWRRTIRVVRGPSPRIEIDQVGLFSALASRRIEAGPGAKVVTRDASRGLTQLVLQRADGTTEPLTMGKSGHPNVAKLVAEMNDALAAPLGEAA